MHRLPADWPFPGHDSAHRGDVPGQEARLSTRTVHHVWHQQCARPGRRNGTTACTSMHQQPMTPRRVPHSQSAATGRLSAARPRPQSRLCRHGVRIEARECHQCPPVHDLTQLPGGHQSCATHRQRIGHRVQGVWHRHPPAPNGSLYLSLCQITMPSTATSVSPGLVPRNNCECVQGRRQHRRRRV